MTLNALDAPIIGAGARAALDGREAPITLAGSAASFAAPVRVEARQTLEVRRG